MNKNKFAILNLIVILFVYLIIILIPGGSINNVVFWLTCVANILLNVVLGWILPIKIEYKLRKDIHNIPLLYTSFIYNIIFLVYLIVLKFVPLNTNIAIIILLILLFAFVVTFYVLTLGKKQIITNIEKRENNSKTISDVLTTIEILISKNDNKDFTQLLEEVLELVKYTDPLSNENTSDVDDKIKAIVELLKDNLSTDNLLKLKDLLKKRNILVKRGKN